MQFKTTDLLVTVLPKSEIADKELAKICFLQTRICRYPTFPCRNPSCFGWPTTGCGICSHYPTCLSCTLHVSGCGFISQGCGALISNCGPAISQGCLFNSCGPGGSACDPTIFCAGTRDPLVIQHMEDLVALRAELQTTLKSLDALQKEGLPSAVGSKAEADALERGLKEALEQVQAAKKNL